MANHQHSALRIKRWTRKYKRCEGWLVERHLQRWCIKFMIITWQSKKRRKMSKSRHQRPGLYQQRYNKELWKAKDNFTDKIKHSSAAENRRREVTFIPSAHGELKTAVWRLITKKADRIIQLITHRSGTPYQAISIHMAWRREYISHRLIMGPGWTLTGKCRRRNVAISESLTVKRYDVISVSTPLALSNITPASPSIASSQHALTPLYSHHPHSPTIHHIA